MNEDQPGTSPEERPPLTVAVDPITGDPYAIAEVAITHGEDVLALADYEAWAAVDLIIDALLDEEN